MKLTFSILWFDDSETYFDSLDLEPLAQDILSWGFRPEFTKVSTPDDFTKYSPYKNFDLIVVDRNLEGYEDGQHFISNLRNHAIYTEVIFYTAAKVSDLWEAIQKNQLEGVFVSPRTNIMEKISRVGQQAIRKVLDLENMRGIVMAEVGEIDHILDAIVAVGIPTLNEEHRNAMFNRFYKDAIKQTGEQAATLDAFSKNPQIEELLRLCDSNKRWQNFGRLQKYHGKLKANGEEIGNYKAEVLDIRNILAHGKGEDCDDGIMFRHHGREYLFNDDSSHELRQTILRYTTLFSKVLASLQE